MSEVKEKMQEKKESATTKEQVVVLSAKQKEVIIAAFEERNFFQNKVKECVKKEGELVSLVLDAAKIDNDKVVNITLNDDSSSLIATIKEE